MTTAIIGTGGIGSAIARRLAAGGETLRLSSADKESARKLAADIEGTPMVAADNLDALQGSDALVLALRFTVLKGVIEEIADSLTDRSWLFRATRSLLTHRALWPGSCRRVKPRGRWSPVATGGRAVGDGLWEHVRRSVRVLRPTDHRSWRLSSTRPSRALTKGSPS